MGKTNVEHYIRSEKSNTQSVDEQICIAHAMWDNSIGPNDEDGVKRNNIEDELELELEYQPRTSLKHLEEIDIVEEFKRPGPDTYVIADWHPDIFIMGQVGDAAQIGIEALIDHVQDEDPSSGDETPAVADGTGLTLRHVVADAFALKPDALEEHLRRGDPVEKLNAAIEAIEESEEFEPRADYGPIKFINTPNRYRLTRSAIRMYEE